MAATVSKLFLAAALLLFSAAGSGQACSLAVHDQYVQLAYPSARTAAVYLRIENPCGSGDRLTAIASAAAAKAELHQSAEDDQGIVTMSPAGDGMPVSGSSELLLEPGGFHGMLTGLSLPDGREIITIILTFEKSGPIEVNAPVRLLRR